MAYPFIAEAAEYGDSGAEVAEVQEALVEGGWWTWVGGEFGPHTLKTVRAFQRANGLQVDGIVGPVTGSALGLATAERGTQTQIAAPEVVIAPPPAPTAGRCTEWESTLEFFAPPQGWDVVRMSKIMYRESRCRPDVTSSTGCCHGLLQMHQMHVRNLAPCGVYSASDLFSPGKNICSASILFQRAGGYSPWRLS